MTTREKQWRLAELRAEYSAAETDDARAALEVEYSKIVDGLPPEVAAFELGRIGGDVL